MNGVTFYEEDRGQGPYKIRIGGSSDFVSEIDQYDKRSSPPGNVQICEGWDNTSALLFETMEEAVVAARLVWDIEGFHTSIEVAS
jgi:hypothetical protein